MKTTDQLKPNFAPVYAAALYPGLAKIFQKHGYALAVHGSLARDFDLVAIPWIEGPSDPDMVLADVVTEFTVRVMDDVPEIKNHGRKVFTISVGFGECAIDLSFMPILKGTK